MDNFNLYQERKLDSTKIWVMFLFFGWSYGSMGKMWKQVFFYLTFGGFGIWTIYRVFTLNRAVRKYNRNIAEEVGLSDDTIQKLNL